MRRFYPEIRGSVLQRHSVLASTSLNISFYAFSPAPRRKIRFAGRQSSRQPLPLKTGFFRLVGEGRQAAARRRQAAARRRQKGRRKAPLYRRKPAFPLRFKAGLRLPSFRTKNGRKSEIRRLASRYRHWLAAADPPHAPTRHIMDLLHWRTLPAGRPHGVFNAVPVYTPSPLPVPTRTRLCGV